MIDDAPIASNDRLIAALCYFEDAYDGPGWYWFDAEHPEEGTVGRFTSPEAARRDAAASGYVAMPKGEPSPFKIRPRTFIAPASTGVSLRGDLGQLDDDDDDEGYDPWSGDDE